MFKPDNSTITRNMHKVSLQNYVTGLPHQRGLEWHGPRPLSLKHAGLTASPNLARICPFCEGKRKEQQFTSRYLHETGTREAGDPIPAVFPGATTQPPCLRFAEGPPPTLSALFFGMHSQKTYLKWEFSREVASKLSNA